MRNILVFLLLALNKKAVVEGSCTYRNNYLENFENFKINHWPLISALTKLQIDCLESWRLNWIFSKESLKTLKKAFFQNTYSQLFLLQAVFFRLSYLFFL